MTTDQQKRMKKAKADYVAGHGSLRDVAHKHGLPESLVLQTSARDGWVKQKNEVEIKTQSIVNQKIAEKNADELTDFQTTFSTKFQQTAMRALNAAAAVLDSVPEGKTSTVESVKKYTDTGTLSKENRADIKHASAIMRDLTQALEVLSRFTTSSSTSEAGNSYGDSAIDNIADTFIPVHRAIKAGEYAEYWLKGGRGSGKSSFASIEIILGLMKDPLSNAVVFRRVYNTVGVSVYEQILWAIEVMGLSEHFRARKSPYEIIYTPTGQRILFRGADDPMKMKSLKTAYGYFKYLWFEELAEFDSMETIRNIKQSVFRGVENGITFYTYNPPKSIQAWVNAEALAQRDDRLVHSSTYLDVPEKWLKESFLVEADTLRQQNETAYRHEYLGEVVGTGGAVFDNIESRTITDEELEKFDRYYNGCDFGFAVDPDAFVRVAFDRRTRTLYVVDEFYSSHTPTDRLAEEIRKRIGHELVRCDSADPRMISELRNRSINAVGVRKGAGSREHGYRWLQELHAIVVDSKRTPNCARELIAYEYEQDQHGNFKVNYPDRNDHTLDALRYSLAEVISNRIAKTGGFE